MYEQPTAAKFGAIPVQSEGFPCRDELTLSSQAIERFLHFLPELFERLTAHGHAHKSFGNFVAPARASFRRGVQASKARGRANHSAIIDEFLRGRFVAQGYAQNHSETQHLALRDGISGMGTKPGKLHFVNFAVLGEPAGER